MSFVVPSAGGVLQLLPGSNVTITGTNQYPVINSSGGGGGGGGNITAGVGIGFSTVDSNTTITNTGVVELYGSNNGISVSSNSGGQYTLCNTGVTSLEVNQDSGLSINCNATTGDLSLDYLAQFVGGYGITVSTSNFSDNYTYTFDSTGAVEVVSNTSNDYLGIDFLTFDGNSQEVILSSYIDWDYTSFSLSNASGNSINISPQTYDGYSSSDNSNYYYDTGYMYMVTDNLDAGLANMGLVTYTFSINIDESTMSFITKDAPLQACIIHTYADDNGNVIKWTRDITSIKDGSDYLAQTNRYDTFSFQKTNWSSNFSWTVEYIDVQSSGVPSFTIGWTTTLAGTGY